MLPLNQESIHVLSSPIHSVALAELDLSEFLQAGHLPANERVVEKIPIGRDHRPAPVDAATKGGEVFEAQKVSFMFP